MNIIDKPHASPESEAVAAQEKEKLQLRRITRALGATWRIPLAATIVLVVVVIAALVALRASFPPTRVYISQFHFTFPSAESGRYPNNSPFSINEILDPAILDVVYDQLDLGKYEVDRNQFYGSFSIRPFVLAESEIAERFRQQMADRRLSFVERERLEQQLKMQLAQASRGAAELTYLPQRRPVIPVSVGRAIVQRCRWYGRSSRSRRRACCEFPDFRPQQTSWLRMPSIGSRSLGHRRSGGSRRTARRAADRPHEDGGVLTVRDSVSGKSIRDLERDIRDLQLFHINPLRAQLVQYRFNDGGPALQQIVERRINDIDVRAAGFAKQSEAVGDSIAQFVQATAGLRGRSIERRPPEGGAASGGTTIPQVGETFIDRIIELTRRDREAEQDRNYLIERTQKQLELNQQAIALRSEQSRWKDLLAELRSDTAARTAFDDGARAQMVRELRDVTAEANANWAALSRMEDEFSAKRTGRTAEIYAPYAAYRDVVSNDLILNATVLGATFWGLIIFFLGFWAIRAALLLARS